VRSSTSPAPFPETADIETASDDYARRFAGEVGAFFLEMQSRATLELLSPWPGARVLELGGGHAQLAGSLVENGCELTVVGSDPVCRSRLDRILSEARFRFQVCNLLELPYPDRSFDAVLAFRLLPHVTRWQDLIGEMCRVAREAVVVDYPDLRSFNAIQRFLFSWKKALEKNTRPFTCFTRRQVEREFRRHGFGRPARRPQFFFPMVIHRVLNRAVFSRGIEAASRGLRLTHLFGSPVILRMVREDKRPTGPGEPVKRAEPSEGSEGSGEGRG
jgi:hypothetical protein